MDAEEMMITTTMIFEAASFRAESAATTAIIVLLIILRQNLTNSADKFGKFRGNTDEIQRLTAATQVKFRGVIKS